MWIKIRESYLRKYDSRVTSFTLVWIKMLSWADPGDGDLVTSFTLVWIKITIQL